MYLTEKLLPLHMGSLSPAARAGSAAGESQDEDCSGALCFCSLCPVAAAPVGEPACRLVPDGDPHPGPGHRAAPAAHPAGVGQRRDPGKAGVPKTHATAARNSPSFTRHSCCSPAHNTTLPVSAPSTKYNPLACSCPLAGPGHFSHTASAGPCPSASLSPGSTHECSPSLSTSAGSTACHPHVPSP